MNRFLKILAIVALVVTIAGAGAVLYGMTMLEPQVEHVSVVATPATEAQATFDALTQQVSLGTFAGTQFTDAAGLRAEDCTFLTYTVRLKNRGFFPAEWIMLSVEPRQSEDGLNRDVLQLADERAHVLSANSQGDLSATILHMGDAGDTARNLRIVCYVFGQKVEFTVRAN